MMEVENQQNSASDENNEKEEEEDSEEQEIEVNVLTINGALQAIRVLHHFYEATSENVDRLFGIVVSMSDCHPRDPGFDSWLYPRNFSGSIGSGMGSTQSREDNWVAT